METFVIDEFTSIDVIISLLARVINWMETLHQIARIQSHFDSLLARVINWMETYNLITGQKYN